MYKKLLMIAAALPMVLIFQNCSASKFTSSGNIESASSSLSMNPSPTGVAPQPAVVSKINKFSVLNLPVESADQNQFNLFPGSSAKIFLDLPEDSNLTVQSVVLIKVGGNCNPSTPATQLIPVNWRETVSKDRAGISHRYVFGDSLVLQERTIWNQSLQGCMFDLIVNVVDNGQTSVEKAKLDAFFCTDGEFTAKRSETPACRK